MELAHWIGVASAAVGRHILWRGIRYHVLPGGQVQKIIREGEVAKEANQEDSDSEEAPIRYRMAG